MSDIEPDTSLYTDMPNKLRAFSLLLECSDAIQGRDDGGGAWVDVENYQSNDRLLRFLIDGCDYRIKPKPRELWAVYNGAGDYLAAFETEGEAMAHCRLAIARSFQRFVEQL